MNEKLLNNKIALAERNIADESAEENNEYVIPNEASCSLEFTSGCIFSE